MTLAPIRGAPPGAPNPDFPVEEYRVTSTLSTSAPAAGEPPANSPVRQPYTPIVVRGSGIVLTFRVIPEQPAIARASMTVHIVADAMGLSSANTLGYLRMSAANARTFLTDMGNGRSPIVAAGDEDGTVRIEFEVTETGMIMSVCSLDERPASHRCIIDRGFDLKALANELLADLGA
jgi:hypothetical protein